MQIQEALSAAPIGEYYCIKPTKPGEPLLIRRTGKAALTKSGRHQIYWTPSLEDLLACDWILTTSQHEAIRIGRASSCRADCGLKL